MLVLQHIAQFLESFFDWILLPTKLFTSEYRKFWFCFRAVCLLINLGPIRSLTTTNLRRNCVREPQNNRVSLLSLVHFMRSKKDQNVFSWKTKSLGQRFWNAKPYPGLSVENDWVVPEISNARNVTVKDRNPNYREPVIRLKKTKILKFIKNKKFGPEILDC